MQEEKLTRREREKLRQRQEILAVALSLFSNSGFHNVSMHEIAEQAEFAVGTLYKFFQNKEDLYKALVLEQCDTFDAAVLRALEEPGSEVQKLQNYVRTKGELIRSNLPFIRLYLAESRGISFNVDMGLYKEVQKKHRDSISRLAAIFEHGIRNKQFNNIANPYHLAVALDSTINAFLLLWLEAPEQNLFPETPEAILDIFLKGLIDS